jgi:NhaP-type Na+/H+ or K+/H+ antiporter
MVPRETSAVPHWPTRSGVVALSLPRPNETLVATFGIVAFSVIVQGLTMPLLLRMLGFLPLP